MTPIKKVETIIAKKIADFNDLCNELAQQGYEPNGAVDVANIASGNCLYRQQWILYNVDIAHTRERPRYNIWGGVGYDNSSE
jgi:hypothetical protein